MTAAELEAVLAALGRAKRIAIVSHRDPDPDTIGSGLALAAALEQLGKEVTLHCADPVPEHIRFLERADRYVASPPGEDVDVVVTVGPTNDPSIVGPQPPNVRVERFVDQNLLLPHCTVAVTHGGAGSTLGALAHGVPLLVMPQGADQFYNAERVATAGAGLVIPPAEMSVDGVRAAIRALLTQRAYREAARRIEDEFAQMLPPSDVRPVLERLATTHDQ